VFPRFFTPLIDPSQETVRLPDDEAHHLMRVLRLRRGAALTVFDGRGHEWTGTVGTAGRSGVVVQLGAAMAPVPEPPVHVTLGVGLQKGDGMETVIQEAVALGVSAIVPLSTTYVAVPARARDSKAALERWQRVAVASVKQCGRATVPVVRPITTIDGVLTPRVAERILMCVEPRRAASPGGFGPRPSAALVLVGPEGGWTDEEVARAAASGGRTIHLGPRTLRADLAPAVLLSAIWTAWGWT